MVKRAASHHRTIQRSARLCVEQLEDRITPGVIDPGFAGLHGPGLGSVAEVGFANATQNNDNTAAKQSFVSLEITFAAVGPIDIVFNTHETQGTTEFWFEAVVTNQTNQIWLEFRWELGFFYWVAPGLGFVPSTSDGLDFDAPHKDPTPTATVAPQPPALPFSLSEHLEDTISWSGGSLPHNGTLTFVSHMIDVPDWNVAMPSGVQYPGGYTFTLRLLPVTAPPVPLPGSPARFGRTDANRALNSADIASLLSQDFSSPRQRAIDRVFSDGLDSTDAPSQMRGNVLGLPTAPTSLSGDSMSLVDEAIAADLALDTPFAGMLLNSLAWRPGTRGDGLRDLGSNVHEA